MKIRTIGPGLGIAGALMLLGCSSGSREDASAQVKPSTQPSREISRSVLREDTIILLSELTDHENPQVRANAIEALSITPSRLDAILPRALGDENAGVRAIAAMTIGTIGACEIAPLCEPLLFDPSPFAQLGAIYAQSSCDDDRHTAQLAEFLLRHDSIRVRAQAAFILGELGNPSGAALLRHAAAQGAGRASDAEFRLLQLQIAEALAKLGDETQRDILVAALFVSRPEDLEATALATQILGEIRSRRSAPELRNLIAFRDEQGRAMPAEIRLNAGIALARMGGLEPGIDERLSALADEFARNPDPLLRSQAAILRGSIGRSAEVAQLREMLDDANPLVQVAAGSGILRASLSGDFAGIRP